MKKLANRCIMEPQCTNVTLLILRGKEYGLHGRVG
nr:MAG TPA: hypothetical protein [Bacteriophage sp.]